MDKWKCPACGFEADDDAAKAKHMEDMANDDAHKMGEGKDHDHSHDHDDDHSGHDHED